MLDLDRIAIECARALAASQPRADYTIPQLPTLTAPLSTDILPIFHLSSNPGTALGNVYGISIASLAAILSSLLDFKAQLSFIVANLGAGNSNAAVVDRIPLAAAATIVQVAVVGAAITAGSTFNIVTGEGSDSPSTALFAVDQAMPLPGVVGLYAVPSVTFPAGTELTLRITTPAGGGLSGVKVTLAAFLS